LFVLIMQHIEALERDLDQIPLLRTLEQKTGGAVKKVYMVLALFLVYITLIAVGFLDGFLTNLVGVIYPIGASMRAIKTKGKDDDTQWLTYWVVYGIFSIPEYFYDPLVTILPFYFPLKLIFILWLLLPQTRVSSLSVVCLLLFFLLCQLFVC